MFHEFDIGKGDVSHGTENQKRKENLDDFWDISKLVPAKKEAPERKNVYFDTKSVEIRSDDSTSKTENASAIKSSLFTSMQGKGQTGGSSEFKRFIPPYDEVHTYKRPKPDFEYENENSLIKKVRVYNWPMSEHYHTKFVSDAVKLWNIEGFECPEIPYFSSTPQYSQLTKTQLAFYLWWRSNFRKGIYLDTDYCYILLYIYEIINLAKRLDKKYCLDRLCEVWNAYGSKYEYVARRMCEWVCDFCLIYRLPPPIDKIKNIYSFVLKNSFLKEFYVPDSVDGKQINAEILLAFCSSYDYRKSRCATAERLPVMEKHIKNVINKVIKSNSEKGNLFYGLGFTDSKVMRISFAGAYCAPENKKKIEIEYSSFSRSHELNYFVADIIRYTENKLRAGWGVKSRLSIYALGTNIKKCIDEYFEENPIVRDDRYDKKGQIKTFEYDKFYEVPKTPFSIENAAKIEKQSWDTTKILVEAFEDGKADEKTENVYVKDMESELQPKEIFEEKVSDETKSDDILESSNDGKEETNLEKALGEKYEFLVAILEKDVSKQNEIAKKLSSLPDALADEINEISSEIIGDIIIDQDENGRFEVIQDYIDLI